jgi:hypothetical protein
MPGDQANPIPTTYEIRIKGHLDCKWSEWLYDLTITHESDGTTTLTGALPDQTVLHTVLERIRDMNLPLISITPIETDSQAASKATQEENRK